MVGSGRRRLQGGGRNTHHRGRLVVVVESPAMAKTIGTWLGPSCRVMATRGHVRDLPSKAGSVDPDDGFAMRYQTGRRALDYLVGYGLSPVLWRKLPGFVKLTGFAPKSR